MKTVWGQSRRAPARLASTTCVQLHLAERAGLRLVPGQLGDAGHQLAELGDLGDHPVEHLPALGLGQAGLGGQQLGVEPQAGQRGAQLVAGVADQLPLGGQRPLQRAEHGVERRGQPTELVGAVHLDPAARIPGRRHVFGDRRQPADRRQPGARHRPAGQRGQPDPDHAEQGQGRADAGHLLVHGGERHGQLHGQARRERRGVHHGADPVRACSPRNRTRAARPRPASRRRPPPAARRRPAAPRRHRGRSRPARTGWIPRTGPSAAGPIRAVCARGNAAATRCTTSLCCRSCCCTWSCRSERSTRKATAVTASVTAATAPAAARVNRVRSISGRRGRSRSRHAVTGRS